MEAAIAVASLSKKYQLGAGANKFNNLTEAIGSTVHAWMRSTRKTAPAATTPGHRKEFWALRDVSFNVQPGEVVGIIGRNGAGKSTLLKILSQIVEPTTGAIEVRGRIGSLLEVGTGFHPELSGRDNIFLNGAILGMSRREIEKKFDEIVAFADVADFLDTPVKRYSSGMHVRLAFAVAAHLEPEILIVDEVLAVGDQEFQDKCLGKIRDVSNTGRTVLFVSHNLSAVQALCTRAIMIQRGRLTMDGLPPDVLRAYVGSDGSLSAEWLDDRPQTPERASRFRAVRALNHQGEISAQISPDKPFAIEIDYEIRRRTKCQIAFRLNRESGETVFTTGDMDEQGLFTRDREPGAYRTRVTIPGHLLVPGRYHLLAAINPPGAGAIDQLDQVLLIQVGQAGSLTQIEGRWGFVAPLLRWREERLQAGERVQDGRP